MVDSKQNWGNNKKIIKKYKKIRKGSEMIHIIIQTDCMQELINRTCLMSVNMGVEGLGRNINDRFFLNLDCRWKLKLLNA